MTHPYLQFGADSDPVAWTALGLAALGLALASTKAFATWLAERRTRTVLLVLGVSAALLSFGYIEYYLRGGPRIVDAAYYYLAGRALSHGYFAFPVPEPLASFSGRFLLAAPGGHALGVLFPPGYPALLALAFRSGAPLALGPALAFALVFVTYWLARSAGGSLSVARSAAGLSLISVALRYHTADTMSHGLSALLLASATAAAFNTDVRSSLPCGALLGWLMATRPVTGFVGLIALTPVLAFAPRSALRLGWLALGIIPGLSLLALQQKAITGSYWGSTQLAYYARSDGPPGCFRYGFGQGIGCLFEHGDYVRARLPNGYSVGAALATTLRRLLVHTLDIANAAPLALGVPLGAWFGRHNAKLRLLSCLVLGGVLAYAPFYFEGSFPGGGARFFADLLPLEHVLLAHALHHLKVTRFAWPLALAGFALHTSSQHRSLRDREGGRPMFEASELKAHGVDRGLLFVNTDHGFALGFNPAVLSSPEGPVIARLRHDALDVLLWEHLGRPPVYCYDYDAAGSNVRPRVKPCSVEGNSPRRIEAESLWPLLDVSSGWAHPDFSADPCVSRGTGLRLHPGPGQKAQLRIALPSVGQPIQIRLGWSGSKPPELSVAWDARGGRSGATAAWVRRGERCWQSSWLGPLPEQTPSTVGLTSTEGLLDYVELDREGR